MESKIFSMLESEYKTMTEKQWGQISVPDLIYFIIHHFHYQHRIDIPALIWSVEQLATKGKMPFELNQLSERLRRLLNELLSHFENEEQIIFPLMIDNSSRYLHIEYCIAHHHHDDHLLQLEVIEEDLHLFDEVELIEFVSILSKIRHVICELRLHIEIENKYLFVD